MLISNIDGALSPVCVSEATKERINPLGLDFAMFIAQLPLMKADADIGDKET